MIKRIKQLITYTNIQYFKKQVLCFCFLCVNMILSLIFPGCISLIVDKGIGNTDIHLTFLYSLVMFGIGMLMVIMNYFQQVEYTKLGKEICKQLKEAVFKKLCNTNQDFWNKYKIGDTYTILDSDISSIEKILTTTISEGILNIMAFCGITLLLIYFDFHVGISVAILAIVISTLQRKSGNDIKIRS